MATLKCSGFVLDCQVWYASPSIDDMTGDEVKAYLYLLCRAWLSEPMATLPSDEEKLARIAKATPDEWQKIRDAILPKFVDDGNGRIYNEKQMQLAMTLTQKKKAGAAGWTEARKRIAKHVAQENGKKHKAGTKAKTKAETEAEL